MEHDYMSAYRKRAVSHINNSLCWLSIRYQIPMERILYLMDMDSQNRVAILDESMQPLITSDNPLDSDVYCPACHNTVSGEWELEHPEDRPIYQCPYCGQAINPFKTIQKEELV